MSQPSIPKGTRDFSPEVMVRRNYIFNTIRTVFQRYGYMPLETPSMENVETLTGKYGDEGDKLIFRILDSGDYLKSVSDEALQQRMHLVRFSIHRSSDPCTFSRPARRPCRITAFSTSPLICQTDRSDRFDASPI